MLKQPLLWLALFLAGTGAFLLVWLWIELWLMPRVNRWLERRDDRILREEREARERKTKQGPAR